MTYSIFLKAMVKIKEIAEENGIFTCDLVVRIRTTSGREIVALFDEVDIIDNEMLQIYADDTWKFLPYSNIESVEI